MNTKIVNDILSGNQTDTSVIVQVLSAASDLYYNQDESFISDAIFDQLEIILKSLDPNNLYFSKVGSDVRGGKIPLPNPMGGLDQVYEGDTEKWISDNGWKNSLFVLGDKMDGYSCQVIYGKGGKLQIAYSRGNGFEGADVTRHILKIPSVPKKVSKPMAVRVEIEMDEPTFAKLKADWVKNGERVYSNARNYTAGKMNAEESPAEFYNNVTCIATSLMDPILGKIDQYNLLKENGFIIPYNTTILGKDITDDFLQPYLIERKKLNPFAIDGVVIDLNNNEMRNNLSRKSSSLNPMYSKKYKVGTEDNKAFPFVKQVIWNISKTGYLKPRVEIEPIELGGVTITYASGFNYAFIKANGIGPGAQIELTRSGDVIPYIVRVVKSVEPSLPSEDDFGELVLTANNVDIMLADADNSPEALFKKLCAISAGFEITGLKEGNVAKLFDAGLETIQDIIKTSEKTLKNILGESAGGKIYDSLKHNLNPIDFAKLAGKSETLGRGIGERKVIALVKELGTDLNNYTFNNMVNVEGFSDKTAKLVENNLPKLKQFLEDIKGYYTIDAPKKVNTTGDMVGISVCFTGTRSKECEASIVAKGGTIASGVNKKLTYLVAADPGSTSGKMGKAKELGVKVISLEEAKKLWI